MLELKIRIFLCAALLLFSQPAGAQLHITGEDKNIAIFNDMVDKYKKESTTFDNLMGDINASGVAVEIRVIRNDPFYMIGARYYATYHRIDVGDILKYPSPSLNPSTGKYEFVKPVPEWATSACAVLAHELAEAFDDAKFGANRSRSHPIGIAVENQVCREYGRKFDRECIFVINQGVKLPKCEWTRVHGSHEDIEIRIGPHLEILHRPSAVRGSQIQEIVEITYEEN